MPETLRVSNNKVWRSEKTSAEKSESDAEEEKRSADQKEDSNHRKNPIRQVMRVYHRVKKRANTEDVERALAITENDPRTAKEALDSKNAESGKRVMDE